MVLGPAKTGLSLSAQLKDDAGGPVAATWAITEVGSVGNYHAISTNVPDSFVGGYVRYTGTGVDVIDVDGVTLSLYQAEHDATQTAIDAALGAILVLQVGGTRVVEIVASYPVIEIPENTETIEVVSAPVSVEIALTQPVIEVSQSANVIEVLED